MYKITNYMTTQAIRDGIKKGHSIYLKPIKPFIIEVDKETGEEKKYPTPCAMPLHTYHVTGPFNKQVTNFACSVYLDVTGKVERCIG